MEPINVITLARTYLGKLEIAGNHGFQDKAMEKEMIELGEWYDGAPWCCCFAQMIFRKAAPELTMKLNLKKLFDPGTDKTFHNFKAAGYTVFDKPSVGDLVIWGSYHFGKRDPGLKGHAGIVSQVIDERAFYSIEGNGAANGSRNGDRVVEHRRTTVFNATAKDVLNVMGFFKVV